MQIRSRGIHPDQPGARARQGGADGPDRLQPPLPGPVPSPLTVPLARTGLPPLVEQRSSESRMPGFRIPLGQGRLRGIGMRHIEAGLPKGTTLADWPGLQFSADTGLLSVGYEREFARGVLLGGLAARLKDDDEAWAALVDPDYLSAEIRLRKVMVRNWQEATHGMPPREFTVPGAQWFRHDATRAEYSGLFRSLLTHGSFVIGEHHDRKTSMRLLLDNLPELAEAGFRTIYLEGLSVHLQEAVDAFLAQGGPGDLPPSHRACVAVLHPLTRQLLAQAAPLHLRVVGLDHHAARNAGVPCKGRLASMNFSAAQVIEADAADVSGSFVVCVGHLHARQATDPFDRSSVMGIAQALGVPAVLVTESGNADPDTFCAGSQREAGQSPVQVLKESVYLDDGVRDEFKGDGWDYYIRASAGASLKMSAVSVRTPSPGSVPEGDDNCSIQ